MGGSAFKSLKFYYAESHQGKNKHMIMIFYNKTPLPTKLWGTGFAKCTKVAFPAPRRADSLCKGRRVPCEAELQSKAEACAGRGDSR